MKAAALAFRFRVIIFLLLYVLGFLAPWQRFFGGVNGTLWLAVSTLLARSGWIGLGSATRAVTLLALASLTTGAALRVWGTAYLGTAIMRGAVLQGGTIIAAGPYRYLRNPLYLGAWLLALGSSILMPVTGALFFLPAFIAFTLSLIVTEERFLATTAGTAYQQYRRLVPRLVPRLTTGAGEPPFRPRWRHAFLAETYPVTFTLCFAFFAWRYNARILIQCLLVCYGLSLVARAFINETPNARDAL